MDYDLRFPVFLVCNIALIWLLQMVNGALGSQGLSLSLGATLLIAPSLFLRLRWGLVAVGLTGLVQGSMLPLLPNGFFFILYALGLMPLYLFSPQLRRLRAPQILLFGLGINVLLILAQAFVLAQGRLGLPEYWLRIGADLLLSSLLFYPVSKWFMNLQQSLTSLLGDDLRSARAKE